MPVITRVTGSREQNQAMIVYAVKHAQQQIIQPDTSDRDQSWGALDCVRAALEQHPPLHEVLRNIYTTSRNHEKIAPWITTTIADIIAIMDNSNDHQNRRQLMAYVLQDFLNMGKVAWADMHSGLLLVYEEKQVKWQ